MNEAMRAAQTKLVKLLEADQLTAGMYVRVRGDHPIAGRTEPSGPRQPPEDGDRVRFTPLRRQLLWPQRKTKHGVLAANPVPRNTRAHS
jgi:hypothetical protein